MLDRALQAGLPARWVAADEAYGLDSKFRTWLQQQQVGYVLAVPRNQRIPTTAGNWRPDLLANAAPVEAWKRRSCGDGAKGPRLYDWAAATLPDTDVDGYRQWLLIRRSITHPDDRAYYLCFGPAGTDDETLIRVTGARGVLPECEDRGRPGPVPGAASRRLVPPHNPRTGGSRLVLLAVATRPRRRDRPRGDR